MIASAARFSIERKDATDGPWRPLTCCNSYAYARLVAGVGLQRHKGVAYRVVHNRSGRAISLDPPLARAA